MVKFLKGLLLGLAISVGLSFAAVTTVPNITGVSTLSTYTEGTFTPNDASGAGLTFSTASGRYVKIGKMVFASIGVIYPATGNGAGAGIGNLPFTSIADNTAVWSCAIAYNNQGSISINGYVVSNNTSVNLYNSATGANVTNTNLSGKELHLSCQYFAAS